MTPFCLAECVRNAEETESQVVCFRREYELENDSLWPMTKIALWNQLEERIVVRSGAEGLAAELFRQRHITRSGT